MSQRVETTLEQLNRAVHDVMPPNWYRLHLEWASIGGTDYFIEHDVEVHDGRIYEGYLLPAVVTSQLHQLRAVIAEERGIWPLSLLVTFQHGSRAGVLVNEHGEVDLNASGKAAERQIVPTEEQRPTIDEWRRELHLHPRDEATLPDWWRERVNGIPRQRMPELPSWMGRPMPQTLADAEAIPERVTPGQAWIERDPGYAEILEAVVAPLMSRARRCSDDELDALFGRRGCAAQQAQRRALAETVVSRGLTALESVPAGAIMAALRQRARLLRIDEPEDTPESRKELVIYVASNVLTCRFGKLPLNWPVK